MKPLKGFKQGRHDEKRTIPWATHRRKQNSSRKAVTNKRYWLGKDRDYEKNKRWMNFFFITY